MYGRDISFLSAVLSFVVESRQYNKCLLCWNPLTGTNTEYKVLHMIQNSNYKCLLLSNSCEIYDYICTASYGNMVLHIPYAYIG
jgi:hypothetical protein